MREIKNFLVVDDSLTVRMFLKHLLAEQRPEWNTVLATGGEDALTQCKSVDIQAMVIDINMPGMDGFELAGMMKELFPEAPITMLTANVQSKVRDRARENGYGFVPKPVTPEKVQELVTLAES